MFNKLHTRLMLDSEFRNLSVAERLELINLARTNTLRSMKFWLGIIGVIGATIIFLWVNHSMRANLFVPIWVMIMALYYKFSLNTAMRALKRSHTEAITKDGSGQKTVD